MNKDLEEIIHKLRIDGHDSNNFRMLLKYIKNSKLNVEKDDLINYVSNDIKLQLHTTPNEIAQLIASIVKEKELKSAIDICCGTGNILYYLQNQIDNLSGVEINENIAALTSYFMPDLRIVTADTFLYPFSKKYDLVVGNVPWSIPVIYNEQVVKSEEGFLRKAFDLVSETGDIILILPYSLLSNNSFSKMRSEYGQRIQTIIGLPSGMLRFSSVKTALVHFTKSNTQKLNIGLIDSIERFDFAYQNAINKVLNIDDLKDRWDPEYYINQDKDVYKELDAFTTKHLSEIAEITKGTYVKKSDLKDAGDFLYLKPVHIQSGTLNLSKSLSYAMKADLGQNKSKFIAQPGDLVISTIFNEFKIYHCKQQDPPILVSNNMAIIRSADDDYIQTYLTTAEGKRIFVDQASDMKQGMVIPHLKMSDLKNILIPILPIADLNELGNNSISDASAEQLKSILAQLKEYEYEIDHLKDENSNLKQNRLFFEDRFDKVLSQLAVVNEKLDTLLDHLIELSKDFEKIKNLPRNEEERLFKLCNSIDDKLDAIYNNESKTIENYVKEIKRWLDEWESLDALSKKFLPIAEFIFDELDRLENADYSPFVIQYCRALENELLKKIFIKYHEFVKAESDIIELVESDLEDIKTGKFAKMIQKDKRTYTLGDMEFILSLLKEDGNTLKKSPLLQHFRKFIIEFNEDEILGRGFLKSLHRLTSEFRNKAAHPYVIDVKFAAECQSILRKNLNVFLGAQKTRI